MDPTKISEINDKIEAEGVIALRPYIERFHAYRDSDGAGARWISVEDLEFSCTESESVYENLTDNQRDHVLEMLAEEYASDRD